MSRHPVSEHYRRKADAQPNAGWDRLAFYAERGIEAPDTTRHPLAPVRHVKARRDTAVPTLTAGKQSKRLKGQRRQAVERAWAASDAAAQRVHDGRTLPDPASLTRAQRDFVAGYTSKHGADTRRWSATAWRHFKRQAAKQGLTPATR